MIRNARPVLAMALAIVAAAPFALSPPRAEAAVKFPECVPLMQWLAASYQADQKAGIRTGASGTQLLSALRDEALEPLFGATIDAWTDAELARLYELSWECEKWARPASRERGNPMAQLYNGHVGGMAMLGMRNRPEEYPPLMRHQRLVHAEQRKAEALYAALRSEAEGLEPSVDAVARLNAMAQQAPRQLAYLPRAKLQEHQRFLQTRAASMGGAIVLREAARLGTFAPTLEGLGQLVAYRAEVEKDLRRLGGDHWQSFEQSYARAHARVQDGVAAGVLEELEQLKAAPKDLAGLRRLVAFRTEVGEKYREVKSRHWSVLNERYAAALNEWAEAALPGFVAELAAAAPNEESLERVRKAPVTLFPYKPTPANYEAYRAAARERSEALAAEIELIACNERLTERGLAKQAEIPILGPDGEARFAELLCAMDESGGYAFEAYEAPGWLGKTHSLRLRSPRGVTLTVEMREVEAVQGRKMLAGVRVKDATTEQPLSLAEWQELALKLAVGAPWP